MSPQIRNLPPLFPPRNYSLTPVSVDFSRFSILSQEVFVFVFGPHHVLSGHSCCRLGDALCGFLPIHYPLNSWSALLLSAVDKADSDVHGHACGFSESCGVFADLLLQLPGRHCATRPTPCQHLALAVFSILPFQWVGNGVALWVCGSDWP